MALLQIVEWDRNLDAGEIFAWRYVDPKSPEKSDALGNWTQLIVGEAQEAVLFRDGQALDLFGPGRYSLSTDNIPLLRRVMNLPTGGESPFKANVWFVNKTSVLDVKWGTQTPILLRDPEYKIALPVRAYGQFGLQISDSRKLLLKLAVNRSRLTREDLVNSFRGIILSRMGDMIATYIAKKKITIFEISAYLRDMSDEAMGEITQELLEYGIRPLNFFFGSINVPEDDESVKDLKRAMSERARMELKGYTYQQERSFDVLQTAAGNEGSGGSMMGAGMGFGTGMGFGNAMGQMAAQMGQFVNPNAQNMNGAMPQQSAPQPQPIQLSAPTVAATTAPAETPKFCSNCGQKLSPGMKFCPGCGRQIG
ncbi:MAG: SPFH domain-containing protein [Synergistaceae bacterium]|nr:SPFH domain-containing protein [Synergistaceae bacterium]